MPRALVSFFALVLGTSTVAQQVPVKVVASNLIEGASASDLDASLVPASPKYDVQAEQQLLELVNKARAISGSAPLSMDPGMTEAARAHAELMVQARQLSHQLAGEPSLTNRLAAMTNLHIDVSGENLALDRVVADAHRRLMVSPPHRENLLNPAYNAAGIGVVAMGDRFFVVEDFGRSLPVYPPEQATQVVAEAAHQARQEAGLPDLIRVEQSGLQEAVCSMASADRLATQPMQKVAQRYTVIAYTDMQPKVLPAAIAKTLAARGITSVAIGACYARTATYPMGVYWVGLAVF